jgi:ribose 5-phosphate isomerase A
MLFRSRRLAAWSDDAAEGTPPLTIIAQGKRSSVKLHLGRHQVIDCRREVCKRADQAIREQASDRDIAVAEVYGDHGHGGSARGIDVRSGIADHDRPSRFAAGPPHGASKYFRVGLFYAERIRPADSGEMLRKLERLQKPDRQPFELVGAHGKPVAGGGETVQRGLQVRKRLGTVGNMRGVTGDEGGIQAGHFARQSASPFRSERPLDQTLHAAADHVASGRERDRRQAFLRQNEIKRFDEVRRGVDQCAVEVKDDGQHDVRVTDLRLKPQAMAGVELFAARIAAGTALDTGRAVESLKILSPVSMDVEAQKRAAAERALAFVQPGMRLGLGTGSTASYFVELLGERVRAGLAVSGVPTSEATRALAERVGIALTTLDETPELDLVVDGADEIAPDLTLIKGGGGALLREKIVAAASARMIVIADESKLVDTLGRFPLPIEIVSFGATVTRRAIEAAAADMGCPGSAPLRQAKNGHAFVTDGGHWLIDAQLQQIADPRALAVRLSAIPGVVEHGLFIGLASIAIIAGPAGVRILERP